MDLQSLTIKEARKLLDSKELSVRELVEFYLKNIESKNKELNVYLEVYADVLEQAEKAQKIIDEGGSKEMTGIPFAIKDNILIKGRKASAASKILENYTAVYTATAAQKMIDQGVVFLGRTNMDEFAMGGSTENSAFGVTKNPHDTGCVAGGSSGGSAVAVAAGMALGALGSDTGGSVREPASFCGVIGLKPTYGAVSRYGLMAMGSSLDVIGPITKTVSDAEILFDVIKGKDKMDSTSIDSEIEKLKDENPPAGRAGMETRLPDGQGLKIGVPYSVINQEGISTEVKKNFEESIKKLKDLGFEVQEIKLANIDKILAVYYIIMPAEVSSNMARYDGMRYGLRIEGEDLMETYKKSRGKGFGPEVRRRIILGTYVLSSGYYDAYYGKAMQAREMMKEEFISAFNQVDAIITPTTPSSAWKIGEKSSPLEEYLADIFTVTANIIGIPAISIPSGVSNGLPFGLQIMTAYGKENMLFKIGKEFLKEE